MYKQKFFEAPTIENDYPRLSLKQIEKQREFASRANATYDFIKKYGYPKGYNESVKVYNEVLKRINATTPINLEALYALDQAVNQTIWDHDTFSQIPVPTKTQPIPRWDNKSYLVQSEEWPRFTRDFNEPIFLRLKESSQFDHGIGMHLGISLSAFTIKESAGALWNPEAILRSEAAAKFGIMKSRRGFLGTSCQGAYADGGGTAAGFGITGLYNTLHLQTADAGIGLDDDITAAGDVEQSIYTIAGKLQKVRHPGKIYFVTSSNVASEMFYHRDTYQQKLDVTRVREAIFNCFGNDWGGWYISEQLYASAPDSTHGQWMAFVANSDVILREYIYPQQSIPMLDKKYGDDIRENMIFADMIRVKPLDTTVNAYPIVKLENITTTSNTGHLKEGTKIM